MRSKRIIYNFASTFLLQLITIVCGFIVPKMVLSYFGSEANGLVSSITQFLGYITLLESGVGPVIKAALYKPIAKKNKSEIETILLSSEKFFRNIAKIFIMYIICLCFIYPILVNSNFGYVYTVSLIVILSISTFAEYYFGMTYSLFLQASQKNYVITLIQIGTYLLNALLTIVMIKLKFSLHIVKLVSCSVFILRPVILNIYIKKRYYINVKDGDKNYKLKQRWDGLAQHIAFVIHKNTDIAVLSIFGNLSLVSIYSVYSLVISGINKTIVSITSSFSSGFGDMIAKEEIENLNEKFGLYELLYYSIASILYTCTFILITPFVKVYTINISDTNYIQYVFGYLIVASEFVWAIRSPYSSLVINAGHFKETRVGAWVECFVNIGISTLLVIKYGLIGVAIGTLVAMLIRSIEYIYHSNKYILHRPIINNLKKILVMTIDIALIIFIYCQLPHMDYVNYYNWFINAIIVFGVAVMVTISIDILFFKNDTIKLLGLIKQTLFKRSRK